MKTHLLNNFLLWSVLILMSACNGVGTAKFDEAAVGTGNIIDSSLVFSGLNSVTDKTDSTITLHWTPHADAVAYEVYNSSVFITTILGQSSNQTNLTDLNPSGTYRFRVRMKTSTGKIDGNTTDSVVVMNAAPNVPSGITLQSPSYSPSIDSTPTVRVSGVKNGNTVKLFTDPTCATEVASGVATGSTIDLTTSNLVAGSYNFYARAIGIASNASACSTATVAYVRQSCPSNYIAVPHDDDVGTSTDFCVAKYEMKNVSSVATSQASGTPWVSISQTTSISTCAALNTLNGVSNKYALISNEEWMTIARNIEQVNENWSPISGIQLKGTGVLARGHTDNSPANALAASTDNDPYSSTSNNDTQAGNSGWEQKRTLTLSNNEVIWDFAGNVWEWTYWNVTPARKAYQSGTNISTDLGWKDWNLIDTLIGENGTDEMPPEKWASLFVRDIAGDLLPSPLDGNNGIGRYYAGINSSGGAALRGGVWNYGTHAGAFALALDAAASLTYTGIGFRCVYRP